MRGFVGTYCIVKKLEGNKYGRMVEVKRKAKVVDINFVVIAPVIVINDVSNALLHL